MLTGVVTSEGTGKRCGDALFESSNRRLLQLSHPALKPKGLAERISRKAFPERQRIKTQSRFEEMIDLKVADSRSQSSDARASLPGRKPAVEEKPPHQKPNGAVSRKGCEICENESSADRSYRLTASHSSEYKSATICVYMRCCQIIPFIIASAVFRD
jgi:hypothetical protein